MKTQKTFLSCLRKSRTVSRAAVMLVVMGMLLPNLAGIAYASETEVFPETEPDIQVVTVDLSQDLSDAQSADGDAAMSDEGDLDNGADAEDADAPQASEPEATPDAEENDADAGEPEEDVWNDITDTKRPEATEDVTYDKGTDEDKVNIPGDKDWEIFYDADRDVYKITFNIGENAENAQVIDLTKALELLGQYAESGKQELAQELQKAIDTMEKPVMGELDDAAPELDEEKLLELEESKPSAPEGFPHKPDPDDTDENGNKLYDGLKGPDYKAVKAAEEAFFALAAEDNRNSTKENALKFLEAQGIDTSNDAVRQYVNRYASSMVDRADAMDALAVLDAGEDEGYISFIIEYYSPSGYWDENGDRVTYTPEEREALARADLKKTINTIPVYTPPQSVTEAFKAAEEKYNDDLAKYEGSEEYLAYLDSIETIEKKMQELRDEYAAALADYEAKVAALEEKYAEDKAAYDAALQAIRDEYSNRINANVFQPGDVRQFELYLTSDSKHTYKYKSGSFTLATPDMEKLYRELGIEPDEFIIGFDGQNLGGRETVAVDAAVSYMSAPMIALFETVGMKRSDIFDLSTKEFHTILNGWYDFTTTEQLDKVCEILGVTRESSDEELRAAVEKYLIDYYSKDGKTYENFADLIARNPLARAELSSTTGNKPAIIGGSKMSVDLGNGFNYNNFYQALFSFAFGDNDPESGIAGITDQDGNPITMAEFLGALTQDATTGRWEYGNKSWTDNGYQAALYYYMDHQEIWKQTDLYFKSLLDGGLNAETASWASLMMAVNIDGQLAGDNWQDIARLWYSSIQLDRMDIDFTLSKTDGETGETITSSETEFQVYYIDTVKDADGNETTVNMYCTKDENGDYTFVTTPSTVWTENGELKIDYAMMKDIVYYLQEMTAPDGYERDTNVYIVMNEDDYNKLSPEERAALEGTFDEFLNLNKSDDGLSVSTNFVNVQIVTPPSTPGNPPPVTPPPTPDPDPEIPEEPTPLDPGPEPDDSTVEIEEQEPPQEEIPDEEVPLVEQPEEPSEEEEIVEIPDDDVPLADVPRTGDESGIWYAMILLAACGLVVLRVLDGKKRKMID